MKDEKASELNFNHYPAYHKFWFGDGATATETTEAMTGMDMTTTKTMTIVIKAMTNRDPISDSY
jgi:hypothetical protein